MAYVTQGRQSATLPGGIHFPTKATPLHALLVVCHGWRTPARGGDCRRSAPAGCWLNPLRRWTRPRTA